jgi:2-methylcitrate dehydratase PrpD
MQQLSAYISRARRKPLPPAVMEKAKHHLLDTVAAMVSGSRLLAGERAISYVRSLGGTKEACVIGSRIVTSAANAALANGMLAHADETDDSHPGSYTHPGCGIVPAALAMAEREGRSGMALLRAVALGYDVGCRLTMALSAGEFHQDGHATHSFGPMFGAAAAAGSLCELDQREVRYLLSYTSQQASGLSCWMRDAEHTEIAFDMGGMPARNGVTAAAMVAHGFTGVADVFSGERSFFHAYGRAPKAGELARELGVTYEIMHADIKRWSVGSPIQAALDSILALKRDFGIRAEDVDRLVVRISHQGVGTVDDRATPNVNMQHMCALALLDGDVTFQSSHDLGRMREPAVLALRRRVSLVGDDALSKALPRREAIVEITLRGGRQRMLHTRTVRGTSLNPMTRAEVEAKACDLLAPVLGKARARKLCNAVWNIEMTKDVRDLRPLLRA